MTSQPDDQGAAEHAAPPASSPLRAVPTERAVVREIVPGAVVVLVGRLDVGSVGRVRDALHVAIAQGSGDLVVHLDGVEVVDASGLGVLVGAHRRARHAGRRLVLVGVPARLERLIRHTRLHRVLLRADSWVDGLSDGVVTG